jgi:hypothetical protein
MEKLALVARLKEGAEPKAAELLAKGAPFDPAEHGLERHTVYLSAAEVVSSSRGTKSSGSSTSSSTTRSNGSS